MSARASRWGLFKLEMVGDPDDGMVTVQTGCVDGLGTPKTATISENLKYEEPYRVAKEINWPRRKPWWLRLCIRLVCRMIHRSPISSYQFGGWTGALKKSYELVDADKYQVIHWLMTEAGYSCTVASMRRSYGLPETLQVNSEIMEDGGNRARKALTGNQT